MRVLVVDDDRTVRETLGEILEASGYEVETTASAEGARALAESWQPHVAVIDYRLPDGTGVEVAGACKALAPDLGAIVLTGHASTGSAMEAVGRVEEYLVKPTPPDALLAAVARTAERSRLLAENRSLLAELRDANTRLEDRVSERTRQIEGLLRVNEAITRSLEVQEVIDAAADAVSTVIGGPAAVYLAELAGGFRRRAGVDVAALPPSLTCAADVPAGFTAVELEVEGGALLVVDAGADEDFLATAAATMATGLRNAGMFFAEREASRLKTMMLATVSHELRTPLTVINGFANLLVTMPHLPEDERLEILGRVLASSERLKALVEDLLDSGAIQGRAVKLDCAVHRIAPLVHRAVEGTIAPTEVSVHIDDGVTAWLDPGRFDQVVANLVSNVGKYGGEQCTITAEVTPTTTTLVVEDDGDGFPEEFLPRAFEPFSQGGTDVAANRAGAGLGLYICRGLVEAMGGWIVARNTGDGARVEVVLQAEAPDAPATASA